MHLKEFNEQIGSCYIALTLDTRKGSEAYPIAIRYTINRERYYYRLGEKISADEFQKVMAAIPGKCGRKSERKVKQDEWKGIFDAHVERIKELAKNTVLTLDVIKSATTGKSLGNSFLSVWEAVIKEKSHGTANSYETAMKSFMNSTGFAHSDGFRVTSDTINKWIQKMTDEGKSKATIGIYLRACRVVVKACINRGYIEEGAYMFGEDRISIPKGRNRREESLTVEKMTELYRTFMEKDYPKTWDKDFIKNVHESLGLFLVMYLGNGMNLADLARITYNQHYFATGGESLMFRRTKTADRSENESEVIVPVIPELKYIIVELGTEKEHTDRIFPQILKNAVTDEEKARRIRMENQNIRKRLRILFNAKGWPERPSPTWCRHSFATNLAHAGVPMQYISAAMGHSIGKSVTMGYINDYPHELQLQYNSKLLDMGNTKTPDDIASLITSLSDDEKQKILEILTKK